MRRVEERKAPLFQRLHVGTEEEEVVLVAEEEEFVVVEVVGLVELAQFLHLGTEEEDYEEMPAALFLSLPQLVSKRQLLD
jgi:hypothetical protein